MNPLFKSLEHFLVDFGIGGCTIWYKSMVDKSPDVKEHNKHGLNQLAVAPPFASAHLYVSRESCDDEYTRQSQSKCRCYVVGSKR